ncbi:MAG: hypothetical protein KKF46_01615 [Nanoarchaeota archaeon]|nr:hypothetical protein [Nanoarchaeota archaeon]MBU1321029.1 hypothetical protein [Nanoarchaeota archaeon]MBU1598443.1 hypothetical protein [Nanoarchaeota archaeon]MBU2441369.1 hypothetical protein [Nanoarchaeota archaeon]
MIELSIPQLGEETRNVKDLVFSILTAERFLSIIELTNRIKKNYNINITYQAVRKAIDTLHRQGVLLKEGKKYSINKEWIFKLKSFFDNLLTKYDSGKEIHAFTSDLVKENYAIYTLSTLYDLDNFWNDILKYLADHMEPNEKKIAFNYGHYTWWMLINLGSETKLYEYHKKKGILNYFVFFRDLPLNKWSVRMYNELGHKAKLLEDKKIDETVAINVVGDTIIQIKYPKVIVNKVRKFFEKYKNTQEMSMKEITQISHTLCEIKFIMFKNPIMAKSLRENYMKKYFSKNI